MATAPSVSSQWIPEDDLLLKNAVESGASLEALAKGAVQFSRRYTLQELRERWYSLLYDPDISAQASAKIFELEISGINPASKLNRSENSLGNKDVLSKRKSESIRRKYYAMRKKFRSEFFSNSDLGFFEPNSHEFSGHGNPLGQNCVLGDSISDHLRLQEEDLDILRHAFPETIRDIAVASGAANVSQTNNNILEDNIRNRKGSLSIRKSSIDENPPNSPAAFEGGQQFNSPNSDGLSPFIFPDPDSLLNLSNEDEILLVDVDEKHAENICSIDNNTDSVLQGSNKDSKENDVEKVELATVTVLEASSVPLSVPHEEKKINFQSEIDVPPKSTTSSSDFTDGKIICTLNTEDTEIPCNDDIFLLIHPSTSFGSFATQPNMTVSINASREKDNEHAENLPVRAKDSTKAFGWSQTAGIHGFAESKVKFESHDLRPQVLLPGIVNKSVRDSSKSRSVYAIPKVPSDSLAEREVAAVDMKIGDSPATVNEMIRSTDAGSSRNPLPESLVDSSVSDHDEYLVDDDVPYFSDIEAMILEMDLDPYDQDSHINRQVPSYQYDETKRTIIRLEQVARSCLQRAMTSQGALAVLYGRHLRHYIRKPEVLLGRSTDDVDVDIDLRKEGRANKISRRQAIIKMEADGSFFLKNLGKSSVLVNGMTVATGQLMNLTSSCLIEIKGMSFVFEINQGYVRKHLANFCLKNKGKTGKSDWSADEVS